MTDAVVRVLHTPQEAAAWLRERVSRDLSADSRHINAGDGFIAWPGFAVDGRSFVSDAMTRGAVACLVEAQGVESFAFPAAGNVACYAGLKSATGRISSLFYGEPSASLKLFAVTGTNGKTSTAWWLAWALQVVGGANLSPCALSGTLGMGLPDDLRSTGLTTSDPVTLQRALAGWRDAGVRSCAMEASSIGLEEHRLEGVHIHTALFTNFSQDHLDYHRDMQAYWQAKAKLFDWPGLRNAVVCVDNVRGVELAQVLDSRGISLWTTSLHADRQARLWAQDILHTPDGMVFDVCERDGDVVSMQMRLVGSYNIQNLLGVMAALRAEGVPLQEAVQACADLPSVPGRMEVVSSGLPTPQQLQPLVLVDYAHTPDALRKALAALRPITEARGGLLRCVFGCGGDRDVGKRPLMLEAATEQAAQVWLTSDNPRFEDPDRIIADVLRDTRVDGKGLCLQPDRKTAITQAIVQSSAQDVILVAGKGHENYQEIKGQRLPFSDQACVVQALAERAARGVA